MRLPIALLAAFLATAQPASSQDGSDLIRVNQVGFHPRASKTAVVPGAAPGPVYLTTTNGADTVFTTGVSASRYWDASGEYVRLVDFSDFRTPGLWRLDVPGVGVSHPLRIDEAVHDEVAIAALKAYYYQRASTALDPTWAGVWNRPAGHADDHVLVHASAATAQRPTNTIISAPRGWYDAGDYNKYIVNSGISTWTLLALFEHYPGYAGLLESNIPESGDQLPDVLDEVLWNIRWMLLMQDPDDGGVYHKLTHANFSGAVMPHEATAPRYVVQKGTAATLDFAAVMAQASRVFEPFGVQLPGVSDSMRDAALDAWRWARANPNVRYDQGSLNASFDPDIVTGAYGDSNFLDEFGWAAAELAITVGADSFLTAASPLDAGPKVPSWPNVGSLGWFSMVEHREQLAASVDTTEMLSTFLAYADDLVTRRNDAAYQIVMGQEASDFVWGSNSVAGNQAVTLLQAFRVARDSTYLWAALDNVDYLLGRNATGYSFLTGFGARSPMHPHHRPSEADGIVEPVPGLLVGGPQPGGQDIGPESWQCDDYRSEPAKSWIDDWCSYATNEITINWNAPLVYATAAIGAALAESEGPVRSDEPGVGESNPVRPLPAYPNPARDDTIIRFAVDENPDVHVAAFNLLGRQIASWPTRPVVKAGG